MTASNPQDLRLPTSASEVQRLETLISSIVEVTRQRDRNALEDCISRVVLHLTEAKTLTVFHLEPKDGEIFVVPVLHLDQGGNASTREANIKPFALSSNAQLAETLRNADATNPLQQTQSIEQTLILPLQLSKGEVCTFCRLEQAQNNPATRRAIAQLLEFYANFLNLLEDNERDALTGLLNRRTFDLRLAKILANLRNQHSRAADQPANKKFCLAALDIDHFKQVNDNFGHVYGDEVLLLFSNLMRKTFRGNDLLFRFGGEEFVVLLADTDISNAHAALERFRRAVETHNFPQIGKITVSIGASILSPDELPRTSMDRADQALYFAKHNGRNQFRVYEALVQQGLLKQQGIQTGPIELF